MTDEPPSSHRSSSQESWRGRLGQRGPSPPPPDLADTACHVGTRSVRRAFVSFGPPGHLLHAADRTRRATVLTLSGPRAPGSWPKNVAMLLHSSLSGSPLKRGLMKRNPFYAFSATAMLLGCHLVSTALDLYPGALRALLSLLGVLLLYEMLLVALGTFLVRSGRSTGDGVTLLVFASIFAMDVTLLGAEVVTVSPGPGLLVLLFVLVLVAFRLAFVRRRVPLACPGPLARLLFFEAAAILALPAVASHLSTAGHFGPRALLSLWLATFGIPWLVRRHREVLDEAAPWAHPLLVTGLALVPPAAALLHLVAVGFIHSIPLHPAFLAPLALGLAASARRDQIARQVVPPMIACLLTLGQANALGVSIGGAIASPARLASLATLVVWLALGLRHNELWLIAAAAALAAGGAAGARLDSLMAAVRQTTHSLSRFIPRDAFSWGLTVVAGAFVFLAVGFWRSLAGSKSPDPPAFVPPTAFKREQPTGPSLVAALLFVVATAALAVSAASLDRWPASGAFGPPLLLLFVGVFFAAALVSSSLQPNDDAGRTLIRIAFGWALAGTLLTTPHCVGHRHGHNQAMAIGTVRTVLALQAEYSKHNGGLFEGDPDCLSKRVCLPGALDSKARDLLQPAAFQEIAGYRHRLIPGPRPGIIPDRSSPSSVVSYAVLALPADPSLAWRSFCGDSKGTLCYAEESREPHLTPEGSCDRTSCNELQ